MKKILVTLALFGFFTVACQKTNEQVKPQNKHQVGKDKSGSTTNLTEEQIEEKCKHISYILTEVIKTEGITQEVMEGVQSGQYADESIRLYDLLNPSQSPITSFQANASTMKFAQAFKNAFNASAYIFASDYASVNYDELVNIIEQEKLKIYFPYSENWQGNEKPTLTYNTVEEKDENLGYAPVLNNNIINNFILVTVDDNYADANAVWIVAGEEAYEPIKQDGDDQPHGPNGVDSVAVPVCPPFHEKNYIIQVKELRVVDQLDNLFGRNCGGPDLVFVRGTLNGWDDKPAMDEVPTISITRKECRKGTWRTAHTDFLASWQIHHKQVLIGLYEFDKKKKEVKKITGNTSFTANAAQNPTAGLTISRTAEKEVVSKNEIQYNVSWDRCTFFKELKQASNSVTTNGFTLGGIQNGWRRFIAFKHQCEFTMSYEEI